jgi:hypothetical protein
LTYEQSAKSIVPIIDDISQGVYKLVLDDYSDAAKSILDKMARMWANAKNVAPEDMVNYAIQYNRLEKMLEDVEKDYMRYAKLAGEKTADNSFNAINESFYRHQYQLDFFTGSDAVKLQFGAINPYLVETSVYGTIESWQKIQNKAFEKIYGNPGKYYPQQGTLTQLLAEKATQEVAQIRGSISSSLIRGESYKDASKAIADIIGKYTTKNGAIDQASGIMYKSLRIMRTEGTRNLNGGSYAMTQYARSEGVGIKRQWIASLDIRTRDSHVALDGKFEDENGLWYIGGDSADYPGRFGLASNSVNCRCAVIDRIEGVELDQRRGRVLKIDPVTGKEKWVNEVFDWKDYPTWAKDNGLTQNEYGAWHQK